MAENLGCARRLGAAMKALHVAGRVNSADRIAELLRHKSRKDTTSRGMFWDGVDIDPQVATGRVIEALRFRLSLTENFKKRLA